MVYNIKQIAYRCLFISICFLVTHVYAEWLEKEELIIGNWGKGPTEFGIKIGDTITYDVFPGFIDISDQGWIVISDGVNGRFKVYDANGRFVRNITPPVTNPQDWVIEPKWVGSNIVLILNKYYFFNLSGEVIASIEGPGKIGFRGGYNNKLYVEQRNPVVQWLIYSPTGQLLSTSPTRPLELGLWGYKCREPKESYSEERCFRLRYEIEYHDATYVYEVTKPLFKSNLKDQVRINDNLIMDNKRDKVYAYSVTATTMPEGSTKPIRWLGFKAEWVKPRDNLVFHPDPEDTTVGGDYEIIAQYGTAVLGPDGSIYTWCRSDTHYKILRWRWVP